MVKRLFKIEDFDARIVGVNVVALYPFKNDRWREIRIHLPHRGMNLNGKIGFIAGEMTVGTSCSDHSTVDRSIKFARAIIAAASYLQKIRMDVRYLSR